MATERPFHEQVLLTLAGPADVMERLPVDRIVGSLDLH